MNYEKNQRKIGNGGILCDILFLKSHNLCFIIKVVRLKAEKAEGAEYNSDGIFFRSYIPYLAAQEGMSV